MSNGNEELAGYFLNRQAFVEDVDFAVKNVQRIIDELNKIGAARTNLDAILKSGGGSGLAAATNENIKAQHKLAAELSVVSNTLKARYTEDAKAIAQTTSYYKETLKAKAANAEYTKEMKLQIAVRQAENNSLEKAKALRALYFYQQSQINLATEDGAKKSQGLIDKIDKLNTFIKENSDSLTKQKINVGNYTGSAKIIVDAIEKEQTKLAELEKQRIRVQNAGAAIYSPSAGSSTPNPGRTQITGFAGGNVDTSGLRNLKVDAIDTTKEIAELDKQIAQSRTVIEGFQRVTEKPTFLKVASDAGDASKELAFFRKQLTDLQAAGPGGSEAAETLKKRLAELTNEVKSSRQEIKAMASDTRSFDLFAESVNFAADTYQTFAGAAALAGASEEDVMEVTKNLVAIQSISNGVKGIAEELTNKGTAANKLYSFSQKQIALAMDSSAAAGVRLRAVLLTIGIGAIIAGIGLLIANFDKIKDALSGLSQSQKLYNGTLDAFKQGVQDAQKKITDVGAAFELAKGGVISKDEALKKYNDTLGDSLGKANSMAEAERLYGEKAETFIKITALKAQAQAAFAASAEYAAKAMTAGFEDNTGAWDKIKATLIGAISGVTAINDQMTQAQIAGTKSVKENAMSASDQLKAIGVDLEMQAAALSKSMNIKVGVVADTNKPISNKGQDNGMKDRLDQAKREYDALKALAIENANEIIRVNQSIVDSDNSNFTDKLAAFDKISEAQKRLATIELNDAIASQQKIEKGKIVEIKKSQNEKLVANTIFNNKIKAINEGYLKSTVEAQKKASADALAQLKSDQDEELKSIEEAKNKETDIADKTYNDSIVSLNELRTKGKISEEQYQEERATLDKKYKLSGLIREVKYTEQVLALLKLRGVDVSKQEAELAKIKADISDTELAIFIENENKKKAVQSKSLEAQKKKLDEFLGNAEQIYNALADVMAAAMSATIDAQQRNIDKQLENIDKQTEKELAANDKLQQSDEDKAKNKMQIEARAAAAKEILEKKQRELDRRKAIADKAMAIFQITLNIAKGISEALGNPFKIALAAISGAAQLALAIATPIPQFKGGKNDNYEGMAWIDDGGRIEPRVKSDGSVTITNGMAKPKLAWVQSDEVIYPSVDAMMKKYGMPSIKPAINNISVSSDYGMLKKLEEQNKILRVIADKPSNDISVTEAGMAAMINHYGRRIKYFGEQTNWSK